MHGARCLVDMSSGLLAGSLPHKWEVRSSGGAHDVYREVGEHPLGFVLKVPREDHSNRLQYQNRLMTFLNHHVQQCPCFPTQHLLIDGVGKNAFTSIPAAIAQRSRLTLLEEDLITPLVSNLQLLSTVRAKQDSLSTSLPDGPRHTFLSLELKPKPGLPALLPDNSNPNSLWGRAAALGLVPSRVKDRALDRVHALCPARFVLERAGAALKAPQWAESRYRPDELFAAVLDSSRSSGAAMREIVRGLVQAPQNNWRYFCDGTRLHYACEDGTRCTCEDATCSQDAAEDAASRPAGKRPLQLHVPSLASAPEELADQMTATFGQLLQRDTTKQLLVTLLGAHALCEGQQLVAEQLYQIYTATSTPTTTTKLTTKSTTTTPVRRFSLDNGLSTDSAVSALVKKLASVEGPQSARRLQREHYWSGVELVSHPAGRREAIKAWLSEYLLARTLADSSVFCNVCVVVGDNKRTRRGSGSATGSTDRRSSTAGCSPASSAAALREKRFERLPAMTEEFRKGLMHLEIPLFEAVGDSAEVRSLNKTAPLGTLVGDREVQVWVRVTISDVDPKSTAKIPAFAKNITKALERAANTSRAADTSRTAGTSLLLLKTAARKLSGGGGETVRQSSAGRRNLWTRDRTQQSLGGGSAGRTTARL